MITESLSALTHSTSETSGCRQGYKSERQGGEQEEAQTSPGALNIMVVHEASMIESKQVKPRIGDKSAMMLNVPRQRDPNTANRRVQRTGWPQK